MDPPQLSQSKVASPPPLDAEVTAVRKPEPEPTLGNQVTTPWPSCSLAPNRHRASRSWTGSARCPSFRRLFAFLRCPHPPADWPRPGEADRKSTRLNSSH